jgi:Ca2+-binding RTX toxin-like protein
MGGSGNSVLLGGEGNDWLFGHALRNLLIGGLGNDTLLAGRGQDILIGGTTEYDYQSAALLAVMREWERTDVEYDVRVENLLAGGGLNGSTLLNGDTVHNDEASDLLISGSGLDLYFASLGDEVLGRKKTEWLIAI